MLKIIPNILTDNPSELRTKLAVCENMVDMVQIDINDGIKTQHRGLGKRLMIKAEEIARKKGYKNMAVISAIGTREYYKKLGYSLEGTYMIKEL